MMIALCSEFLFDVTQKSIEIILEGQEEDEAVTGGLILLRFSFSLSLSFLFSHLPLNLSSSSRRT